MNIRAKYQIGNVYFDMVTEGTHTNLVQFTPKVTPVDSLTTGKCDREGKCNDSND